MSNRDSSPVTRGRSVQPRNKVGRFLKKVAKTISRSKSRSRDHVLPNVDYEDAPLIPNIEETSSGVEQCTNPQSALREAKDAAEGMNLLLTPLRSGASSAQDAQANLEAAYGAEDTYLQPLRVFDSVIGALADVHPYAKIALGLLSHACKIVTKQHFDFSRSQVKFTAS
ncbi:hypothetical protein CY34DRAFT_136097 [Suillus luteus UH-Slu-Lm8-n1]|uniref:Uncharacterized protein n=1 Tax=Suillus luteus UH-Slu-Lm8-n1 TaxID=930992 RepID=A0A0C9ZXX7_9AGAM|nr:hypothetical protein CY34DRAFT_136097 [Suillus luteus UH-Slu-Lm8-n1]